MVENNNGKVSWQIFIWAIGIILLGFGWIFTSLAGINNKTENFGNEMTEYKADIREIKTNVVWIMDAIKNTNNKIEAKK